MSCGIVLRSYILRRRYQRRLEEALGTGLLLAPRAQGSKRKRFGTKPKMINTWLTEGGEKWNQMMVRVSTFIMNNNPLFDITETDCPCCFLSLSLLSLSSSSVRLEKVLLSNQIPQVILHPRQSLMPLLLQPTHQTPQQNH